MYAWTDPGLAAGVADAAAAGVKVRLTLDSSQFKSDKEKEKLAADLTAQGVDVSIGTSEKRAIQHIKSGIIDMDIAWSGSMNWSLSGEEDQDNQLTLLQSAAEAKQFTDRFAAIHAWQLAHCPQPAAIVAYQLALSQETT
jgi:phosphatidylserine/phosphatidylglycerophosphate/cardiolipin synthase-like enzyme